MEEVKPRSPSQSEMEYIYSKNLIAESDLMITEEEEGLFPAVSESNTMINNETRDNTSFLLTEVSLDKFRRDVSDNNEKLRKIHEGLFAESSQSPNQSVSLSEHSEHFDESNEKQKEKPEWENPNEESADKTTNEDAWDTDLDVEDGEFGTTKDHSITAKYVEYCTKLQVVPVSTYIQNISKQNLVMKHHGLGPQGTKALAKSLEANIHVDTLDLSGNWMSASGAVSIGKLMEENNFLTKLVLSDNVIGDEGVLPICKSLLINTGLKHLDLSGNRISDTGCQNLAEIFEKSRYLLELDLSRNDIGTKGGKILGDKIGSNDIMEFLNLSWNKIRGEGAIAVSKGLKENIRLKYCDLSYNGFASEGGKAIAETIRDNSALITLKIEANRLDDEIATLIGKALTANESLEELRLGLNPIKTPGILNLVSSLNSNDSSPLKILYLTDIPVDYETTKVIQHIKMKRSGFTCIHGLEIGVGNHPEDIKKRMINPKHPLILLKEHVLIKDKRLIDILQRIDENNNFYVTVDQFGQALEELGVPFKKTSLDDIRSRLDKLGNGCIYYGDFLPKQSEPESEEIRSQS